MVGFEVGWPVGISVGRCDGVLVGFEVFLVGIEVGWPVSISVGFEVGWPVGVSVGFLVGIAVGVLVGFEVFLVGIADLSTTGEGDPDITN